MYLYVSSEVSQKILDLIMIYHHSAHHMSFKKFPDGVSTIYKSHIMSCSEVFKKDTPGERCVPPLPPVLSRPYRAPWKKTLSFQCFL